MWARYIMWYKLLGGLSGWFPETQLNMYLYCQWWERCGIFLIVQIFFMFVFFFSFLVILAWLSPISLALSWSGCSQVAFGCFISRIYKKTQKTRDGESWNYCATTINNNYHKILTKTTYTDLYLSSFFHWYLTWHQTLSCHYPQSPLLLHRHTLFQVQVPLPIMKPRKLDRNQELNVFVEAQTTLCLPVYSSCLFHPWPGKSE